MSGEWGMSGSLLHVRPRMYLFPASQTPEEISRILPTPPHPWFFIDAFHSRITITPAKKSIEIPSALNFPFVADILSCKVCFICLVNNESIALCLVSTKGRRLVIAITKTRTTNRRHRSISTPMLRLIPHKDYGATKPKFLSGFASAILWKREESY